MYTYNFIYYTIDNRCEQVEINADTTEDAWKQVLRILDEIVYIDLIYD